NQNIAAYAALTQAENTTNNSDYYSPNLLFGKLAPTIATTVVIQWFQL
ncbi:hypothetical protein ACUOA8_11580, partial [Escherichia sp. SS-MK2]